MQRSPVRDLIVGVFVFFGLVSIGYLSIQVGGLYYSGPSGFELVATFDEVGDLKPRAAVVIAGVKVGQVVSIELDDIQGALRTRHRPASGSGVGRRDLGRDHDRGATRREVCRSGTRGCGRNA